MKLTLDRQTQPSKVFDNSIVPLHLAHRLFQTECMSESGVAEKHVIAQSPLQSTEQVFCMYHVIQDYTA